MTAEKELKTLIENLRPDLKPYMQFSLVGTVVEVHEEEYLLDIEVSEDVSLPKVPVLSAWAEDGWGVWALPEVGSEVSIGFVEGDVTRPYVEASRFVAGKTISGYKVGMFAIRDKTGQRIEFKPDQNELSIKGANIKVIASGNRADYSMRDRSVETAGNVVEITGKNRSDHIRGSASEKIDGDLKQTIAGLVEQEFKKLTQTIKADLVQKIGGKLDLTITGASEKTVLDSEVESVAKNWQKMIGGTVDLMITNANAESIALAIGALTGNFELNLKLGDLVLKTLSGGIELSTLQGDVNIGTITPGKINLGGTLAIHPAARGDIVKSLFSGLVDLFVNNAAAFGNQIPPSGGQVTLNPALVIALKAWAAQLDAPATSPESQMVKVAP